MLFFAHSSHVLQVHCSIWWYKYSCMSQWVYTYVWLTFVCYKSQMRWLGVSLEALLLDNGQPVIQVFKTGIIGDVVHKHNYLQNKQHAIISDAPTICNVHDNHIYNYPAFSLLMFVHQCPTPAVPHSHHLQCYNIVIGRHPFHKNELTNAT